MKAASPAVKTLPQSRGLGGWGVVVQGATSPRQSLERVQGLVLH